MNWYEILRVYLGYEPKINSLRMGDGVFIENDRITYWGYSVPEPDPDTLNTIWQEIEPQHDRIRELRKIIENEESAVLTLLKNGNYDLFISDVIATVNKAKTELRGIYEAININQS